MKVLLLLLLSYVAIVLAQNACYYAANKRAGSAIIPCSSTSSVSACCQIGDLCLADSACWNPQYNVTYLYGCTDPSYKDVNCPYKCGASFDNAPYVGLDYCVNTTKNAWSCTHPPSNDPAIAAFPAQQCLNDSIIAFAGPNTLQPILSLPTNVGGSTLYFSQVNPTSYRAVTGYTPTSTPRVTASIPSSVELVSATTTSGSRTGSATTTATGVATSSASTSQADEGSSGLSTGAKIGIGAGIGGAAIAIAAIVIAWMVLRKRKASQQVKDDQRSSISYHHPPEKTAPTGPLELPTTEMKFNPEPTELPDLESRSGTPVPTYTSWTRPQPGQQVYEMPATNDK